MKKRLGGKGLSLGAFVAAKAKPSHHPADIKKNREFYQNAKKVQKYKKLKKSLAPESEHKKSGDEGETNGGNGGTEAEPLETGNRNGNQWKQKQKSYSTLGKARNDYEKQQQEVQKMKEEKEKQIAERKEARERADQARKQSKAKMFKRTSRGQPVMKHRLEQILQHIS